MVLARGLPKGYDPQQDKDYMSPYMLRYFKDKLKNMLNEILKKENEISHSMLDEPYRQPDHVDEAASESLHFNEFMFQEHEDLLRHEVEEALGRINKGTYGYCADTGDPIGVKRLLSVPTAIYRADIQQAKEREKGR